jgi:hypothetical protein
MARIKPVEQVIEDPVIEEPVQLYKVLVDIKGMVNNIQYDLKAGSEVVLDETAVWIFKDKVRAI